MMRPNKSAQEGFKLVAQISAASSQNCRASLQVRSASGHPQLCRRVICNLAPRLAVNSIRIQTHVNTYVLIMAACFGSVRAAALLCFYLSTNSGGVARSMTRHDLAFEWAALVNTQRACRRCEYECAPSLIQPGARPLFGRFKVWKNGILFLFEAPNWDDTFNKDKGYLTCESDTDPSGRFARRLMVEELGLDPDRFQVTNSVLCLPAKKNGRFPISVTQRRLCGSLIRDQIRILDPFAVVPVGRAALEATRHLEPHPYRRMIEAVARPIKWSGRWLFPLFHTSMLARNGPGGRREEDQRRDWRALRDFLKAHGIKVPSVAS